MKSKIVALFVLTVMLSVISVCYATDMCYEYIEKKKYDDAISECTRQINGEAAVDDIGISYTNRGIAYAGKGQYEQAIDDYNKAVKAKPKYEKAYFNRGNAYYTKGQYEQAIDDYKKVIEMNPKNPNTYYNMACIYSVEACKWLKKSVENGFKNWDGIKKDKDLDNIRNSSCYKEIIKEK
jgi:tetratricopeptide (TPR) repeat protein